MALGNTNSGAPQKDRVPKGGARDEILAKNSIADYDSSWKNLLDIEIETPIVTPPIPPVPSVGGLILTTTGTGYNWLNPEPQLPQNGIEKQFLQIINGTPSWQNLDRVLPQGGRPGDSLVLDDNMVPYWHYIDLTPLPTTPETIPGGIFPEKIQAGNQENYQEGQIRNIFYSTELPAVSDGIDGDIWILY